MPAVLKYLVVDDDELDRMAIEREAGKFPFLQPIASCSQGLQAAELIRRFQPDILFADIEMPGMTGLELVSLCRHSGMLPVFITSHPEFAVDGFELEAFDYLLKPLSTERFARCASRLGTFFSLKEKAYAFDQEQESGYISIRQGYGRHRIRIQDILFLEAMKDYTRIRLEARDFLVLTTLGGLQQQLPAGSFLRIHRSFVVNVHRIREQQGNRLFVGAHELPVGKLYRGELNGKF